MLQNSWQKRTAWLIVFSASFGFCSASYCDEDFIWSRIETLPTSYEVAKVVNGKIYAIKLNSIQEYDPELNRWSAKTALPPASNRNGNAVFSGKIYMFPVMEVYDPQNDSYTTKNAMPTPRSYPGVAVLGDKIYVIGGESHVTQTIVGIVEVYDPASDTWSTKASMTYPRENLSAAVVNGRIYAIGGANSQGALNIVEEYNPETDTWTRKSDMPSARYHIMTSVINNKIFAFGGRSGIVATVEEYYPSNDTWTIKKDMPKGRAGPIGDAIGRTVFVLGGYKNSGDPVMEDYKGVFTKFPTLTATGERNYEELGVFPETGTSTTTFVFRVKYTDADNDPPKSGYPKLYILNDRSPYRNSPYAMTEADSADKTYSDGKIYYYGIANLPKCCYLSYYFEAFEEIGAQATGSMTRIKDGPKVTNMTGFTGEVTKSDLRTPLKDVAVSVIQDGSTVRTISTDADGYFAVAVPSPGSYDIKAALAGYREETKIGEMAYSQDARFVEFYLHEAPKEGEKDKDRIITIGDNFFDPSRGKSCKIMFSLPAGGDVKIGIYDALGRRVRNLLDQSLPAGNIQKDWDGRTDSGDLVSTGVYSVFFEHPTGKETAKVFVKN